MMTLKKYISEKATVDRYRKKPVEIEAMQFIYDEQSIDKLKEFCSGNIGNISKARSPDAKAQAEITTLEDGSGECTVKHIATEGDFIIKGVEGEFYACKPDIFVKTYEQVK